MNSKTTVNY